MAASSATRIALCSGRRRRYPGADPDSGRQAGDGGGDGQHGGRVAVVDEVVLGDPDVVVAELLGVDDFVEDFVVELGPGLAPLGRIAEVVDQAELRLACVGISRGQSVRRAGCRGSSERGRDVVELVLDRCERVGGRSCRGSSAASSRRDGPSTIRGARSMSDMRPTNWAKGTLDRFAVDVGSSGHRDDAPRQGRMFWTTPVQQPEVSW